MIGHHDVVLFDHGAAELPTATLMPKTRGLALLAGLQNWVLARWSWLVPRTVPVLVAAIGLALVLISADYLGHAHLP